MRRPRPEAVQRVLPGAAMACVVVVDHVTWRETSLLPLFSVGPALAAAYGTRRRVLLTGLAAVVLCALTALAHERLWSARSGVAQAAIVCVTAAAGYAAAARQHIERRLTAAQSVADTMQQVLLEPLPAVAGATELAGSYLSASDTAPVGGDIYDAVVLARGVRLMVGDVQGKGLPAVRVASVALSAFRESAPYVESLARIGERIGKALERRTDGERFVTCVLAEVGDDGTVEVLNCGHPPPLIRRQAGAVEFAEPDEPGPPLGLHALTGAPPGRSTFRLAPGDQALFYTDGLSEARDQAGDFYPLPARAGALLDAPPREALRLLREDTARYVRGPVGDDSALLIVRRARHAAGR